MSTEQPEGNTGTPGGNADQPEERLRVVESHPHIELHEGILDGSLVRIAILSEAGAADSEVLARFTAALDAAPEPGEEFAPVEEQDLSGPRPWAAARVFDDPAVRGAERLIEAVTGRPADTGAAAGAAAGSADAPWDAAPQAPPSSLPPPSPAPPAQARPYGAQQPAKPSRSMGCLVVPVLIAGAVGGGFLASSHNAADRADAQAEADQRQEQAAQADASDPVPEAPFLDPMPQPDEPEPADTEPVGVVGPVFGEDEALEVRTELDLPFAFHLPDEEWTCVVSGAAPGTTRPYCIDGEPGEWTERVRIAWSLCPDGCSDEAAAAMQTDWIDDWLSEETVAELALDSADDTTAYAELAGVDDDGEEVYVLVVSHVFDSEFGPAHVGVITDGHPDSTETLQKIANDVRTQAGAAAQ